MNPLIIPYKPEHFATINGYFPPEWDFDFRKFISINHNRNYFRGFSLLDGREPIGFGNLMVFGSVCWIGNIVVSEKHRNKGLGTKITEYLIQKGRELGANTFNLVATELGESIYRRLGFETECMYEFYKLEDRAPKFEIPKKIRKANPSDLLELTNLDHKITGEKREGMTHLFREDIHIHQDPGGKLSGYYLRGLGDGFIAAGNSESGIDLLKVKLAYGDKKVVVPLMNVKARDFLIQHGFKKSMELPRMTLGEKCNWKPEHIFSRGTGYCG